MLILTKSERRGLLFIAAILLIGILIQWIRPHKINTKIYDYTLQDSLFKALSADTNQTTSSTQSPSEIPLKAAYPQKKKQPLREKSININTANQSELERLPRIGPGTAKLIIEYREKNGPFKSINELDKVKRIGPKTLELIEPYIFIEIDSSHHQSR